MDGKVAGVNGVSSTTQPTVGFSEKVSNLPFKSYVFKVGEVGGEGGEGYDAGRSTNPQDSVRA